MSTQKAVQFKESSEAMAENSLEESLQEQKPKFCTKLNASCFLLCMVGMTYSYPFDFPMLLSDPLRKNKGMTDENIEDLYSAYSVPNVITSILLGYILTKYGPKVTYYTLALALAGQIVFS